MSASVQPKSSGSPLEARSRSGNGQVRQLPNASILSRREPYLDSLNYIQLDMLKRYRNSELDESERAACLDSVLRTINAIAAGMRNTG